MEEGEEGEVGKKNKFEMIQPNNYNKYSNEYSLSFYLFNVLSSIFPSFFKYKNEDEEAKHSFYRLILGFSTQLEMLGHFQWAVYILLNIPDPKLRRRAIQQVLNRNSIHFEDISSNPADERINFGENESFLIERLKVPVEFIYQAKAYAAGFRKQYTLQFEYLIRSQLFDDAHSLFIHQIAPYSSFQFHIPSKSFLNKKYEIIPKLLLEMFSQLRSPGAYQIYFQYFSIFYDIDPLLLSNSFSDLKLLIENIDKRRASINPNNLHERYILLFSYFYYII